MSGQGWFSWRLMVAYTLSGLAVGIYAGVTQVLFGLDQSSMDRWVAALTGAAVAGFFWPMAQLFRWAGK